MSNNSKENYVNLSNAELEKSLSKSKEKESPNLFNDAYNIGKNIVTDLQGKVRQVGVLEYGALVGAVKDAPNEFLHRPWETIGKLSVAGATGVALGAAMAAESPVVVTAATAASIVGTTAALWNTYVKLSSDKKLQQSLDAVYKSGDKQTVDANAKVAAEIIGPEAFNYGLAVAGGLYGSKVAENVPLNFLTGKLRPFIPVARTYSDDAVHMTFADGSAIHVHGEQAIYQTHGWEYDLKINNNGIDMEALGSIAGRQILKGSRSGDSTKSGAENYIKVDIDPKKNSTKLSGEVAPSYVDAEKFDKHQSGWIWSSCKQCSIEDDLINNSPIRPYE
jgi:hypothetical protein